MLQRFAACAALALLAAACDRSIEPAPAPADDPQAKAPAPDAPAKNPAPARAAPPPAASAEPVSGAVQGVPSDEQISARVENEIRSDPRLAGSDLSVNTQHGVVSVTGTVRSHEQVAEAEARAQAPSGVMRVETHVSVNPS